MEKFVNIIRYIFCVPIAFVISILVSGLASIIQNFIKMVFCKIMLIVPHFVGCDGNFSKRTFIADLIFFSLFVTLSGYIAPNHKKAFSIFVLILCLIFQILVSVLLLINLNYTEDAFNTYIITVLSIIWLVYLLKK